MRKVLLFILCLAISSLHAMGTRPTEKSSSGLFLGFGGAKQLDTYLSPLEYHGTYVTLLQEYRRNLGKDKPRTSFRSIVQADLSPTRAVGQGVDFWGANLHYDATWQYLFFTPIEHLTLMAGGGPGVTVGGVYSFRGGNNPGQAHIEARLSASLGAKYDFTLRKTNFCLQYQADVPLVGMMFSPAFGQSYYEIFVKKSYDHNIVPTYFGKAFSLRQFITLDINLNKKKMINLRIGYLGNIRQAKPNHLIQHQISNSVMVGLAKHL